jgi:hypothetical protein
MFDTVSVNLFPPVLLFSLRFSTRTSARHQEAASVLPFSPLTKRRSLSVSSDSSSLPSQTKSDGSLICTRRLLTDMYTQTRNITNAGDRLSKTLFARYDPKVRYTKRILVISSYFCSFCIKKRILLIAHAFYLFVPHNFRMLDTLHSTTDLSAYE